jgi:4-hydroxy-3-polyprenylbenzoate decarboxylase
VRLVKRVTVVDADIDPWDPAAVDWARLHRMKLERDLKLMPEARTDRSEAMESGGLVTKIGLDATAKPGDRVEGIDRALPPRQFSDAARKWFEDNLAPEKRGWLK